MPNDHAICHSCAGFRSFLRRQESQSAAVVDNAFPSVKNNPDNADAKHSFNMLKHSI